MSKAKFYSMTKPIPFRKTRLFFRVAKDTITSVIYNILYKLNIIEKYSFNDVLRNGVPVSIPPTRFESGCVRATLEFSVEHQDMVNECFYHKKGNKLKKLYVISDEHFHNLYVSAHMTDIGFKMPDGKFMQVENGLPVFKTYVKEPVLEPVGDISEPLEKPKYRTQRINMRPLQSLTFRHIIPVSEFYLDEIKEGQFEDVFSDIRKEFTTKFFDYFADVRLTDLLEEE